MHVIIFQKQIGTFFCIVTPNIQGIVKWAIKNIKLKKPTDINQIIKIIYTNLRKK